jgi:hypothetical protein
MFIICCFLSPYVAEDEMIITIIANGSFPNRRIFSETFFQETNNCTKNTFFHNIFSQVEYILVRVWNEARCSNIALFIRSLPYFQNHSCHIRQHIIWKLSSSTYRIPYTGWPKSLKTLQLVKFEWAETRLKNYLAENDSISEMTRKRINMWLKCDCECLEPL